MQKFPSVPMMMVNVVRKESSSLGLLGASHMFCHGLDIIVEDMTLVSIASSLSVLWVTTGGKLGWEKKEGGRLG